MRKLFAASATACIASLIPLTLAAGYIQIDGTDPALAASRAERILSIAFALNAFFLLFARKSFPEIKVSKTGASLILLITTLPLLFSFSLHAKAAYQALLLGDHDFTNMSESINNTAKGFGLFTTPYFNTGERGSYLGHHFSPALLLYVPVYFIAGFFASSTHATYAVCLLLTLAAGFAIWIVYFLESCEDPFTALTAAAICACGFPLWRLSLSYHHELLVFPFSGLAFLFLRRRNTLLFLLFTLLWISVKEDIPVYTAFFGAFLFFRRPRRTGAILMIVSTTAYLIINGPLHTYFAGSGGPDWTTYWKDGSEYRTGPVLDLLTAFSFLPLLQPSFALLTLLPIFIIHFFSSHSWHASFYGHYVYTILPFLLYGATEGLKRIESRFSDFLPAICLFSLSIVFYSAASDRQTPPILPTADAREKSLSRLVAGIPAGACVQTQIPFSAHVRLSQRVFPLMIPEGNPIHSHMPTIVRFQIDKKLCPFYYLLLDPEEAMPPYYTRAHVMDFYAKAQSTLILDEKGASFTLFRSR